MNTHKAEVMLEEVTSFLCSCGTLPAMKGVDDDLDDAEQALYRKLNRLFVGVENRLISRFISMGYIPTDAERRTLFVTEYLSFLYDDASETIVADAMSQYHIGRLIAFEALADQGLNLSFTEFDPWTRDLLREKVYTFSQDTARRIIGDVANNLAQSYEQGLGIDDAAQQLRQEIRSLRKHRLQLIARTEINSAQNEGVQQTLNDLNVNYKQWITARDRRVRGREPQDKSNHIKMHGEIVKVDEAFSNGLRTPGDRSGPIAEWINCRCRIRPYFPRRGEMITSTPYRK
ncbi:phage head morphogenesis protein [Polycladospora coralii]